MNKGDIIFIAIYTVSLVLIIIYALKREHKPQKSCSLIHCSILCFREGNELLGLSSEDFWLPACIDLNAIIAIKKNGGANEEYARCAVMYHSSDYYVIDIYYEEAVRIWTNFKRK